MNITYNTPKKNNSTRRIILPCPCPTCQAGTTVSFRRGLCAFHGQHMLLKMRDPEARS